MKFLEMSGMTIASHPIEMIYDADAVLDNF